MNTNAKTRKNRRQRKMNGGFTNTRSNNNINNNNNNTDIKDPHQGPFGYVANLAKGAVTGAASKAAGFIANRLGYAKIDQPQPQQQLPSQEPQEPSLISNLASGVGKKINQVGSVLVDSLNESVENSGITETIPEAIGKTVDIAKDVLEKTSEKLEDPQFQEDLKIAASNIADKASIVLDAADKPLNKLVDKSMEIGEKLGEKMASSAVKIGLDTAGMIPVVGEIVEGARVADDIAKAGFAVADAGAQTIKMSADTVTETLNAIQEKINQAENVLDRTSGSVNDFVDTDNIVKIPQQGIQKGGNGRKNNNSKKYKYTTRYLTRRRQRQRQRQR
jgi:hypothetical protein